MKMVQQEDDVDGAEPVPGARSSARRSGRLERQKETKKHGVIGSKKRRRERTRSEHRGSVGDGRSGVDRRDGKNKINDANGACRQEEEDEEEEKWNG